MEREKFSSRIGFILISAGCAIDSETYGAFLTSQENTAAQRLC